MDLNDELPKSFVQFLTADDDETPIVGDQTKDNALPPADSVCPVCTKAFVSPVSLSCNHLFCESCVWVCEEICILCKTPTLGMYEPIEEDVSTMVSKALNMITTAGGRTDEAVQMVKEAKTLADSVAAVAVESMEQAKDAVVKAALAMENAIKVVDRVVEAEFKLTVSKANMEYTANQMKRFLWNLNRPRK